MFSSPGLILGDATTSVVFDQFMNGALKILFIIAFLLYVIFAFIATRQIDIMRKTVQTPFSGWVRLVGFIHLGLAITVFVLFLLV